MKNNFIYFVFIITSFNSQRLYAESGTGLGNAVRLQQEHEQKIEKDAQSAREEAKARIPLWELCEKDPVKCQCNIEIKKSEESHNKTRLTIIDLEKIKLKELIKESEETRDRNLDALKNATDSAEKEKHAKYAGVAMGRIEMLEKQQEKLTQEQERLEGYAKKFKEEIARAEEVQKDTQKYNQVKQMADDSQKFINDTATKAKKALSSFGESIKKQAVENSLKAAKEVKETAKAVVKETPVKAKKILASVEQGIKDLPPPPKAPEHVGLNEDQSVFRTSGGIEYHHYPEGDAIDGLNGGTVKLYKLRPEDNFGYRIDGVGRVHRFAGEVLGNGDYEQSSVGRMHGKSFKEKQ